MAHDLTNPSHLIAVDTYANRPNRDRDPAGWLPPNTDFLCVYVLARTAVKRASGLTMDKAEADAIRAVQRDWQ